MREFIISSILFFLVGCFFSTVNANIVFPVPVISEGRVGVQLNGKWGFFDMKGNRVISPRYNNITLFKKGLAVVELNGKWGCIDLNGKEVIPFRYDSIGSFKDDIAWIAVHAKGEIIDMV